MLYVGTSGWAYKEWRAQPGGEGRQGKPGFYPLGTPQAKFLQHYATQLPACEVNATFYRTPPPSTVAKWSAATPEGFRFAFKAHRALTYSKQLAPTKERTEFLQDIFRALGGTGPRFGCLLLQTGPHLERDDEALQRFLNAMPSGAPFAFDFRNPTWDCPEMEEAVAAAGGTVCLTHRESPPSGAPAPDRLPPGPVAYVRLRAPSYSGEERAAWAKLLAREARRRPVFSFVKHEGAPAGDPEAGVGLAVWLKENAA